MNRIGFARRHDMRYMLPVTVLAFVLPVVAQDEKKNDKEPEMTIRKFRAIAGTTTNEYGFDMTLECGLRDEMPPGLADLRRTCFGVELRQPGTKDKLMAIVPEDCKDHDKLLKLLDDGKSHTVRLRIVHLKKGVTKTPVPGWAVVQAIVRDLPKTSPEDVAAAAKAAAAKEKAIAEREAEEKAAEEKAAAKKRAERLGRDDYEHFAKLYGPATKNGKADIPGMDAKWVQYDKPNVRIYFKLEAGEWNVLRFADSKRKPIEQEEAELRLAPLKRP